MFHWTRRIPFPSSSRKKYIPLLEVLSISNFHLIPSMFSKPFNFQASSPYCSNTEGSIPGLLGQVLLQDRLAPGGRLPRSGAAEPAAELAGRGGMHCGCGVMGWGSSTVNGHSYYMGLSENVVYPYTQWLMIIIPFLNGYNWGYTPFSDIPVYIYIYTYIYIYICYYAGMHRVTKNYSNYTGMHSY